MTGVAADSRSGQRTDVWVRPAVRQDLSAVADVHAAAFRGFFLTDMGKAFLTEYYRTVLDYRHGILLVAEATEGVVGFVSGFLDPDGFYRFMSRCKWRFAVPAALAVLRHPGLLQHVFRKARRVTASRENREKPSAAACELSSVAVHPERSRRGLGRLLVSGLLQAAASQGAERVFLTTDARDNERVNSFYCGLGFELARTFDRDGQRLMNEYVMVIRPGTCDNRCES